ncbi:GntR family transcriptional regulator [Streptomonospora algeriensis]|uniref:GntR family transcriptional regulator n=1 Tax=Streptomonospora algeriensis TaxID=995084 RepID=A0ABW3BCN6_9ACTN
MSSGPPSQPYKRVLDALHAQITSGELQPGDQLPPTRDLAEQHGVASMTARRALQALREEGRAEPRHGVGWFIIEPPPPTPSVEERLAALETEVEDLRRRVESA